MRLVHQRLCREVLNCKITLRTVRLCWPKFARGSFNRVSVKKFIGGRSARISRTVREWIERWGRLDLTYNGCPSHNHPPNRTHHPKSSFSLSTTWGRRQGQGFLAWFPDGPRTSPDSSQDWASCPLGILTNS